ncbi:MMPL family transporter [Cellulomonas sp.]|uniref:MMPL family transporter n=1 Tax=Cellulomonas sp. TaxID=40001 RepID=UPI002586BF47|nr:MMPL family transporter [Cellulomonas sp.]MCR6689080.1 MMPL family transporter [Cellulomonas sp.]
MSTLANWCTRRRSVVLWGWLLALLGLAAAALGAGASFTDATELPDSESSTAYALMAEAGLGSDAESGAIVWQSDGVAVDDAVVQADVEQMLAAVGEQPGVLGVVSPYGPDGAAQVSADRSTAFASVRLSPDADPAAIRQVAEGAAGDGLRVALGGQAFTELPSPSHGTEGLGILVALVILYVAFRSRWAAALPILTGVVGVGASMLAVVLGSHVVTLSSTALTMGSLIGLGVGIDYALFIVNRYRKALVAGRPVPQAIAEAVTTSGRAVVFAGLTVIVALLGMFVVGLGVLTGMAQAAAVTVAFTVAAALTLLPALLATLGTRVLSARQRAALAQDAGSPDEVRTPPAGARWALLVQRRPRLLAVVSGLLLVLLALPVVGMRVGNADATSDPEGSPGRTYTELMGPAFGEGVDATLVLVARVPDAAAADGFADLMAALPDVPGVAAVRGASPQDGQDVAVVAVTPVSSAQTEQTQDLVAELRDDVIPAAAAGTDLEVYVGGETATNIDISQALMSKLPLYLGLIALLGFLLLAVAFRSVLVPLVGALTNVATILVGLGAITAIFQLGWGSALLGVGSGAPVMYIVPVIIVGVMFGLSMDYQVFLVSRMHEEWDRTGDNARAVRVGQAETAKVVATAATIMLAVFASFGFSGERIVSAIGIGLALAVLVDAFVVRMVLVPAVMHLLGRRNWAYPRWADRLTPHLALEGGADGDDLTDVDPRTPVAAGATSAGRAEDE